MGKKIAIIVPHEDDELNLFGPFFEGCLEKGFDIEVAFVTNGDYSVDPAIRFKESQRVAKLLGVKKTIYFGYPDSGGDASSERTIYEADTSLLSHSGYRETYTPDPSGAICDYGFAKRGRHSPYTRSALVDDIGDYLAEARPDIVITTGPDPHPDHRITSAVLDEAMRRLILSDPSFRPTYLKGFAYLGTWHGFSDYFDSPLPETLPKNDGHPSSAFPYVWDERIRLFVESKHTLLLFWRSPLFRAYWTYHSQRGTGHFFRCVNSDKCFWPQSTSNLALHAQVSVSSGSHIPINDFQLCESREMRGIDYSIHEPRLIHWTPSPADTDPAIIFKWTSAQHVKRVRIHNGYDDVDGPVIGQLVLNSFAIPFSFEGIVGDIFCDAWADEVKFYFDRSKSSCIAVREIEIFDETDCVSESKELQTLFPALTSGHRIKSSLAFVPVLRAIRKMVLFIDQLCRKHCLKKSQRTRHKPL